MFDHNIFQENCKRVTTAGGKMVSRTIQACWQGENTSLRTPTCTATARSPTSAGAQPVHRRVLTAEALQSAGGRESFLLMEGRHVHPSTLYPAELAPPQRFS